MSDEQIVMRPQRGPQEAYCATEADICLFG